MAVGTVRYDTRREIAASTPRFGVQLYRSSDGPAVL